MDDNEKVITDGKVATLPENEKKPVFKLALPSIMAGGADYFGLGLITPLLPFWLEEHGEDLLYVGLIQTAQYFGVILGSLVLGRLSDMYGRKRAFLVALSGDVVLFLMSGLVETADLLLTVRLLAGMFTPLVVGIAWVNDVGDGDAKLTGKMMAQWAVCMSLAFMLGGVVGGLLGASNWIWGHALSSFMALVAFVYIWCIDEPPRRDAGLKPSGVPRVLASAEFRSLLAVQFVIGLTFTGTIVVATLIAANELDLNSLQTAGIFSGVALFHLLENLIIMPIIIEKFGDCLVAMDGSAVLSIIFYAFLSTNIVYDSIFLAAICIVISSSIVPVVMTGYSVIAPQYATRYSKNAKGVILGISRLTFNIGQMLGPVVGAGLYSLHPRYFYLTFIALTVLVYVPWRSIHGRSLRAAQHIVPTESDECETEEREVVVEKAKIANTIDVVDLNE